MEGLEKIGSYKVLEKDFQVYGTLEHPLFKASDVAELIEYSKDGKGNYNVSVMLSKVDNDEKIKINTNLNNTKVGSNTWFLTEDGLYEVCMQSRKPIAKELKKQIKAILKQVRLTDQILIEQWIEKWNGELPTVSGSNGNMIDISKLLEK